MLSHLHKRLVCSFGHSIFSFTVKGLFAFLLLNGVLITQAIEVMGQTMDFKTYLKGAHAEISRHKEIIQEDPLDAIAYFELGRAYLALGKHEEEVEAYKEAIQLRPKYTAAHYNLGVAYDLLKQGSSAIHHMAQSLELYTQNRNHVGVRKVQRQLKRLYLKYPATTKKPYSQH
jgi:tetratricopeptide (TPR) repeat protein